MPTKTSHCLSAKDIATICDVYKDIRFDFDQNEILSMFSFGVFGSKGKHLRSVTVNGEMKWGLVDGDRLSTIVECLMSKHTISSKWSVSSLLNQIEDSFVQDSDTDWSAIIG